VATKQACRGQLYETDFALWLEEQALALKERRSAALDWDNLAEEIEGLVRSDRRSLKSFLENALLHLLQLAYWETGRERNQRQWRDHLIDARNGITYIIEDSPSLGNYLPENVDATYERACHRAESLIGRELSEKCPWTLEQLRSDTFFPDPVLVPRKHKAR